MLIIKLKTIWLLYQHNRLMRRINKRQAIMIQVLALKSY